MKVEEVADLRKAVSFYRNIGEPLIVIDTETTGLHIIEHDAFMYQVLIVDEFRGEALNVLINFLTSPELKRDFLKFLQYITNGGHEMIFANAKFDLHKMVNQGIEIPYDAKIKDVLIMTRLCAPTDTTIQKFALKSLGKIILGIEPEEEHDLKEEVKRIKKTVLDKRNAISVSETGLRYNELKKRYYDPSSGITPEEEAAFEMIEDDVQDFRYSDISAEVLERYAYNDTELTYKMYEFTRRRVVELDIEAVTDLEHRSILPIMRMERTGFKIDLDYVVEARNAIRKEYMVVLQKLRMAVTEVAVKSNLIDDKERESLKKAGLNGTIAQQHSMLKVFFKAHGIKADKMDKQALDAIVNNKPPKEIIEFVDGVKTLRRLSKWYGTYLSKYLKENYQGRFYCSIKQSDTVTGRMSSDFHQFPKGDIVSTITGEVLFKPRNIVLPDGTDGYNSIYYFDYSQIELRIQAHYTLLFSTGDTNLCRAFMPYKTVMIDGEYRLEEDTTKKWEAIDLHSMTTATAFPTLDVTSKEFKSMRNYGKATNFAKNYGGGIAALNGIMGDKVSQDVIRKLNDAYDTAFPKVKEYGEEVTRRLSIEGQVRSLAGRRYSSSNSRLYYKCNNYVIQGSGVDILKRALIRLDEFIIKNNLKTRVQMAIHDELSFLVHKDEELLVETYFKSLMEVNDFGMEVPIVCDVEKTTTNWGDKYEI